MARKLFFGAEGRQKLKKGVDTLADAVKVTLGAKGRNVIIGYASGMYPHVTKDGVTVASSIEMEDTVEEMGAALVKQVAANTAKLAGDGTSTSTVLSQAIFSKGLDAIDRGANPMDLKRGMDKAVKHCVDNLKAMSKNVVGDEDLKHIATISANNDSETGEVIAEVISKVGRDGDVSVTNSPKYDTYIEKFDGMKINRGFISHYFITNKVDGRCELENCYVLLYDKNITVMGDIIGLVKAVNDQKKTLLIIADDVDGEALATLVTNQLKGLIRVCAIQAPAHAEERQLIMEDLAVLTGGKYISHTTGQKLSTTSIGDLGYVDKAVIDKDKCVLIGAKGDKKGVEDRCAEIRSHLEQKPVAAVENMLKSRLAALTNGVAVLYVGAVSESELKEKKDRIDDALRATQAALEEGFVAGGGTTYLFLSNMLNDLVGSNEDEARGIVIIKEALLAPFECILSNAGKSTEQVSFLDVINGGYGYGYDAKNDAFCNMFNEGIIDPTKVSRVALENAASVASVFLTTEAVVYPC